MKKFLLIFLGFLLAQTMDYVSCSLVSKSQENCYPLWSNNEQLKYQNCMNNDIYLKLSSIIGFNFVYSGRKVFFGY